jgi:hypothetical protein
MPTNAAEPPDSPEPATAPPPSASGPLGARNLPPPAELGNGWQVYSDPGGAEKGFRGNGTWTRKRDAHQAAFEALPIGCANELPRASLPVPRHALLGTYRNSRGLPAQALVLRFADDAAAAAYFSGYQARMKACGTSSSPQGLTVVTLWSADGAAAAIRRYADDQTYVEVSVHSGSSVGLLGTAATPDRAWTHTTATRLATSISR